jgi:hypothetical protein
MTEQLSSRKKIKFTKINYLNLRVDSSVWQLTHGSCCRLEAEIEASAGVKTLPRIFITSHFVLAGNQVKIGGHCSSSSVERQKGTERFPDGERRTSYMR